MTITFHLICYLPTSVTLLLVLKLRINYDALEWETYDGLNQEQDKMTNNAEVILCRL